MRTLAPTLFLICVVAGTALSSPDASADCPPSVLTYWFHFHGGDTYVPAVEFDTTIVDADGNESRVAFDHARASVTLNAVGRLWIGERVLERIDVAGVPVGTVVHATLALSLLGEVYNNCGGGGCGAYFTAALTGGTDSLVFQADIPGPCDACTRPVNTTLLLPVSITAGTPLSVVVSLLYHSSYVAYGRATVAGVYGVSGLPEGVRAVGCAAGDVTPVRRESWGRLKTIYR